MAEYVFPGLLAIAKYSSTIPTGLKIQSISVTIVYFQESISQTDSNQPGEAWKKMLY